ncbi:DNA polymerase I [Desulfobotulus alkaliphilus]|uniref:DNA polymerase I n=1 Tax=Desulfobotulus alkaliphilus TaxID=622671 RepID=A0A562S2G8_9BACT|nr:DNA polymerase I [Desulfobotulus alkaliphilus]TWI75328.1 DNA polymerase I [Desulfobotulus alkaliphilus]
MTAPTLYLIDGSAYIYRSYHAIRNLSSSKGEPTNATFGFTRTIIKLLESYRPEYAGVLFDAKGPTFRHEIYPEYKANRPPMPEDLVCQIDRIHAITKALGLPILRMEGWEADDLAGTLALQAKNAGFHVVLVTGDKDFLQLVDENTKIFDPMKDVWSDVALLKEKFGFDARGVVDMMALTGDSSDNIPGVPGIGPKTATALIKEYGSLEKIYDAIPSMGKKKMVENLINNREKAFLSRKLAAIDCHAPIDFNPEEWRKKDSDKALLVSLFRELDFRQLQESFSAEGSTAPEKPELVKDYQAIFTANDLKKAIEAIKKAGIMAFDTETTGLDALSAGLVGISFSWKEDQGVYIPIAHLGEDFPAQLSFNDIREELEVLFSDPDIIKVAQNLKYDWTVLSRQGIRLEGPLKDTLIASYLIDPTRSSHSLDALAMDMLGHRTLQYKDVVPKKGMGFEHASLEKALPYACEDADITLALWKKLQPELEEKKLTTLFETLEMPLVPVLMRMEERGIAVDREKLRSLSAAMEKELSSITGEIHELAGSEFNINSPQQMGHILFEVLGLPVQKKTKKKTGYSTDVSVLESLADKHPLPAKVLRHRTLAKLKNTYADALQELIHPASGRIHTSFNQGVTATGRLSSSSPNLQNIPIRTEEGREIRKVFIPQKGWQMMAADYSQIELRLLAHYSEDRILMESFRENEDIHTRTAAEIFQVFPEFITEELRRQAKTINFGIMYGMGPYRLAGELGISQKMAKTYITHYFARYAGVKAFMEKTVEEAREKGFTTTLFGRIRPLPDIDSPNHNLRQMAERIAVNTPIQGSAADLIKMAMVQMDAALRDHSMQTRMLLTVHDELVFEVPEEEKEKAAGMVMQIMENVAPLKVPLLVNLAFGSNWSEAH